MISMTDRLLKLCCNTNKKVIESICNVIRFLSVWVRISIYRWKSWLFLATFARTYILIYFVNTTWFAFVIFYVCLMFFSCLAFLIRLITLFFQTLYSFSLPRDLYLSLHFIASRMLGVIHSVWFLSLELCGFNSTFLSTTCKKRSVHASRISSVSSKSWITSERNSLKISKEYSFIKIFNPCPAE